MNPIPTLDSARETAPEEAESAARALGFGVRDDASDIERDLRDTLVALQSDAMERSDCAGPLKPAFKQALAWLAVGLTTWLLLAAMA